MGECGCRGTRQGTRYTGKLTPVPETIDPRDRNLNQAIRLAALRSPDAVFRTVLTMLAESEALIQANDGSSPSLSPEQSAVVRLSLNFPHDTWPKGTPRAGQPVVGRNGGSVGVMQAIPTDVAQLAARPWGGWGSIQQCMTVEHAVTAFLRALMSAPLTADPVQDCWRVQRWRAPDPKVDFVGFRAAPSTENYYRRLDQVHRVLTGGTRYFTDGGK